MKRLLVFDLDGTLVETAPDLIAGLNAALATEGLAPVAISQAKDLVGHGVRALILRGLSLRGVSLPEERIETLFGVFLAHSEANIAATSYAYPGLIDQLMDLQSQGWRFAVCTNKREDLAKKLIRDLKMSHWFEAVCGGDTFAFRKPDPRHLTETIRVSGGGDAIMVGDSRTDVDAARAAGIPIIGVTFGYTDVPMKDLKPDALIDHFDQFAEAVHRLT